MSDQLLITLTTTAILNLAVLLFIWVDARRHNFVQTTDVPREPDASLERALRTIEHTKEMLLIDIRRREQLLDVRLQRLERHAIR